MRFTSAVTPERANAHILVVDDSEVALRAMQHQRRRFKATGHFADSGGLALTLLPKYDFDIVFLEVTMAGLSLPLPVPRGEIGCLNGFGRGTAPKILGMSPTPAPASAPIRVISSMATKQILTDLAAKFEAQTGQAVSVESVGGVDAAKRVQAGDTSSEVFDVVLLARNAMDQLHAAGKLQGDIADLLVSGVAVAVPSGAARPDISSEAAVKQAVLNARSLGYSTGPSGVQLARLFERWGIADIVRPRTVQAPPGLPVGALIARGEVALGFQQLSEMLNVPGIDMIGMLPPAIEIITTFSGAVAATCAQPDAAEALLRFMASPECASTIRQNGMDPA